jgi:hypothetical protein
VAPTLEREEVERRIAEARLPAGLRLDDPGPHLRGGARRRRGAGWPGTITVEVALPDRPMVVAARVPAVGVHGAAPARAVLHDAQPSPALR